MSDDLEPVTADGPQPGAVAPSDAAATRPLSLAFLAAAAAALAGGLLWALIVIATGYKLGFLAVAIGAFTGLTARRVAGAGGIGRFERGLSGVLAAGAIIVGNYVIFVHEVKDFVGSLHIGVSVGYFNSTEIDEFVRHFGTYVHGLDWVWIALAAYAAIRTSVERSAWNR